MKGLFLLLTLILSTINGKSQESWTYFPEDCLFLIDHDISEEAQQLIKKLAKLNKITRGDTGECSDQEACLKPYKDIVSGFDSLYSDSTLIEIVKQDYCPIVSCYAFSVLVCKDDSIISEQEILELALPFAKQNYSFVTLDWGCGWNDIETFDYIISLISGKFIWQTNFLPNIRAFSSSTLNQLLAAREPYYQGKDSYNRDKSWEEYKSSFF